MTAHALMIQGSATGNWTASVFTISGASVMQPIGGIITDQDPAGNITYHNPMGNRGISGQSVRAVWDEANNRWQDAVMAPGADVLPMDLTSTLTWNGTATAVDQITGASYTVYDWVLTEGTEVPNGSSIVAVKPAGELYWYAISANVAAELIEDIRYYSNAHQVQSKKRKITVDGIKPTLEEWESEIQLVEATSLGNLRYNSSTHALDTAGYLFWTMEDDGVSDVWTERVAYEVVTSVNTILYDDSTHRFNLYRVQHWTPENDGIEGSPSVHIQMVQQTVVENLSVNGLALQQVRDYVWVPEIDALGTSTWHTGDDCG